AVEFLREPLRLTLQERVCLPGEGCPRMLPEPITDLLGRLLNLACTDLMSSVPTGFKSLPAALARRPITSRTTIAGHSRITQADDENISKNCLHQKRCSD